MDQLTATQQEHKVTEEQRIRKAVVEQDAKQAQQQREEEEKKAEMLRSIAACRESLVTQTLPHPMCRKTRSRFKVFPSVCMVSQPPGLKTLRWHVHAVFLTETRKGAEGQNGQTKHPRSP